MRIGEVQGYGASGFELDAVALVIVDGEGEDGEAGLPREGGADHRIEAA